MNKTEQQFCTKLSSWLKTTAFEYSMAIECKVCDTRFSISDIRPGQWAVLMKLKEGIPVVHKIADNGSGSKLVDLLYIYPDAVRFIPYVAIKFGNGHSYLIPFDVVYGFKIRNAKSFSEADLKSDVYRIKFGK